MGASGHLGSRLHAFLEYSGMSVQWFDNRSENLGLLNTSSTTILLDVTRINASDSREVARDKKLHIQLLDQIETAQMRYFRIASALEIRPLETETEYVVWSREKSQRILKKFDAGNPCKLIYTPNIYGGEKSQSIVDRLIYGLQVNRAEHIRNPDQLREFVDIETFCKTVAEIVGGAEILEPGIEITSSTVYNISNIRDYIHGNVKNLFGSTRKNSEEPGVRQYKVVDQLKQYIDSKLPN